MTAMRMVVFHLLLSALLLLCGLLIPPLPARAAVDAQTQADLQRIEHRLDSIESHRNDAAGDGAAVLFLFGVFCALWAQNTRRSAWLWFFLGYIFSVITVLVLLYKNSGDRRRIAMQGRPPAPSLRR